MIHNHNPAQKWAGKSKTDPFCLPLKAQIVTGGGIREAAAASEFHKGTHALAT
jgi:hypothetical protein